jgi:hypothetical protein
MIDDPLNASQISAVSSAASSVSISLPKLKQRIINLTNELLDICKLTNDELNRKYNIPAQISSVKQLRPRFFVYFYEIVCDTELVGKRV